MSGMPTGFGTWSMPGRKSQPGEMSTIAKRPHSSLGYRTPKRVCRSAEILSYDWLRNSRAGHPLFDKVRHEKRALRSSHVLTSTRHRTSPQVGVAVRASTSRTVPSPHGSATKSKSASLCTSYLNPSPSSPPTPPDDPTRYYSAAKAEHVPGAFIFVCQKTVARFLRLRTN